MSDEQQQHIDEFDYQEYLKDVGNADFSQEEKDAFRKLLAAGYRNLNGDPMEKKVQMLARTDWLQIQKSIADSKKMLHILAALEDIRRKVDATPSAGDALSRIEGAVDELRQKAAASPQSSSFSARLFDFLKAAKTEIATIVCFAIFFPNGGAVLEKIAAIIRPGG